MNPNIGFWRDTHLRITGEAALDLQAVFDVHWNIAEPERVKRRYHWNTKTEDTRKSIQDPGHILQNIVPPRRAALSGWSAEWGTELRSKDGIGGVHTFHTNEELQEAFVHTLEGNPGIPTPVVRQAYFICITQASRTIDITTPYFVPDADIIMALKTAVVRGVRVRLLVPRHVDQIVVDLASWTYYGELLEAGVHIYLYDRGMLHAKLMIIDEEIAEVGAANYDMRSFRLNYEVCEILYSADVARQLTEQFQRDLTDSVPLSVEQLMKRSLLQRIIEQGARLLSPLS